MSHTRREDVTIPEFGTRLKKALFDKRISQRELSRRINVSYSLIGSYINDQKYPSLETLILICRTLKITPDYLLELGEVCYPLAEENIEENVILEWAKNQSIFGDWYKYFRRQGCKLCPMMSKKELAYLKKMNLMFLSFTFNAYESMKSILNAHILEKNGAKISRKELKQNGCQFSKWKKNN